MVTTINDLTIDGKYRYNETVYRLKTAQFIDT